MYLNLLKTNSALYVRLANTLKIEQQILTKRAKI